jgi:molybdate transport system regulatory protein
MPRSAPSRRSLHLKPRVKVWLETQGCYAFGFGLAEMLQAVDRAGSIKEAAADLGKSYRYVWGRIKGAEKAVGMVLVDAHVGGTGPSRSFLTPAARKLTTDFLALRKRMILMVGKEFDKRFRQSVIPAARSS